MKKILRITFSIVGLFLFAILFLQLTEDRFVWKPNPSPDWTNESTEVPSRPILQFNIPEGMEPVNIVSAWYFVPEIAGKWKFRSAGQAVWIADSALSPNTKIEFGFNPNAAPASSKINKFVSWKATTRLPRLLIIKPDTETSMLSTIEIDKFDTAFPLSSIIGEIGVTAVSPDGSRIFYTLENAEGGSDIWRMRSSGGGNEMVKKCGNFSCNLISLSSIPGRLLYFRKAIATKPPEETIPGELRILDTLSGTDHLLLEQIPSVDLDFAMSTDERWLSIYLGENKGIEVRDMTSNLVIHIADADGNAGSWSPDSRFLYYQKNIRDNILLRYQIAVYDFDLRQASVIAGDSIETNSYDFFMPKINPISDLIVCAAQANLNLPGRELWVFDNTGALVTKVSADIDRVITNYEWSPDGRYLLFRFLEYPLSESVNYGISDLTAPPRFFQAEKEIRVNWQP